MPFDDLEPESGYSASGQQRYRPQRRGKGGSFWKTGVILFVVLALIVGGAYLVLDHLGVAPGSENRAAIRAWFDKNLNDPSSLEIVEWGKEELVSYGSSGTGKASKGTYATRIVVRVRAKNALGAKVVGEYIFFFQEGKMISANAGD